MLFLALQISLHCIHLSFLRYLFTKIPNLISDLWCPSGSKFSNNDRTASHLFKSLRRLDFPTNFTVKGPWIGTPSRQEGRWTYQLLNTSNSKLLWYGIRFLCGQGIQSQIYNTDYDIRKQHPVSRPRPVYQNACSLDVDLFYPGEISELLHFLS